MSRPAPSLVFPIVTAFTLAAPGVAWPQAGDPKLAWEALGAFVSGVGGSLTGGAMRREGAALVVPDTVLRLDAGLEARLGEVRLEPAGDEVLLRPGAALELRTLPGEGGVERAWTVAHDGALRLGLSPERLGLGLDFGGIDITQVLARQDGRALDEAFSMTLEGTTGRFGLTLAEPHALEGDLSVAMLRYTVGQSLYGLAAMRQDVTAGMADTRLTLSAAGLRAFDGGPGSFRRALEGGLAVSLRLSGGRSTSAVRQTMGPNLTLIDAEAGGSSLEAELAGDGIRLASSAEEVSVRYSHPGLAAGGTLARMAFGIAMPLVATAENRPFTLSFDLAELSLDPALLNMVGAAGFAGDAASLRADLRADGRWLVEITENPDPDILPFELTTLGLTDLTVRLGAAELTGNGSFAVTPGTFGRPNAPPDGTGDFVVELRGGNALLGRLAAAGLIPPDQQFMAQMMLNGLGRAVGEDHLRSDIAIRPGNVVTVNGIPLPF